MVIGILTITLIPILVGIGDILMAVLIPVIGWIIDIISGVIDILNGVITFLVGVFTGDWEKAWDGVAMIFEGIWNTLVAVFKGIINFFIDIINGAINAIGSVVSTVVDVVNSFNIKIPDWVPLIGGEKLGFYLKKPNIPQIPHLADGGLAYGQTLAMIGEYDGANNNPEVIAPLSKLENMMNVDLLAQKLDKLIAVVDSKEFNAYISQRDVGKAAINYINGQSRILGGSVI